MSLTMLNGSVNQKQPTIFPQQPMELCPSELNRQSVQVAHVNSFSLQTLGDGVHKQVSRANSYRSLDEYSDQDKFVERHNTTAEIYQIFKDNVDTLFSRKILPEKQAEFVNRILTIVGQLLISMEAEKQYLMSEVLCGWAVQQQKLSVAAQWTQQMNYSLLNTIDTQFEYFGELLEQTLTGLGYLVSEYPGIGFEQYQQQLRQMTHLFLFYSIIVSRQPPSVVVKCGEAENHRRSRFWFNTEIRILGGRAFGLDRLVDGVSIQCLLITDETAKRLRNNAYHDICEHEEFAVEPMIGHLKNFDPAIVEGSGNDQPIGPIMVAKFEDMRVAKKEQLRRESVAQKRYHLCYTIKLQTLKHQIDLVGKKVSLPFAILVGPKMDVDAKLFMERSFADFVRRPDGELPALVNGQEMALLEIPQKPTDQIALNQPRPFNLVSKQHLLGRLKPDVNGQVPVENFLRVC
uniref:Signal transducer and activator of transcription b N-terminal domain-containing protein n=1 Tax=Meloidogyne incognita TaxID=6306 RepID=A0A914KQS0_MELIC